MLIWRWQWYWDLQNILIWILRHTLTWTETCANPPNRGPVAIGGCCWHAGRKTYEIAGLTNSLSLNTHTHTHTHTHGLTQCNLSHIDACLVSNLHARWLLVHAAWFVDSFDVYRGKDLRLDLDFVTVCRVSKAYGPVGETCEWQLIPTRGILHLKIWWYESCFTPAQGCQKI